MALVTNQIVDLSVVDQKRIIRLNKTDLMLYICRERGLSFSFVDTKIGIYLVSIGPDTNILVAIQTQQLNE